MKNAHTLKVMAAQYEIQQLKNWSAYQEKIERLVTLAKEDHADLLVLPEYAGLELSSFKPATLIEQFAAVQFYLNDYLNLFKTLAAKHQIYIQPGTLPVEETANHFKNRAFFFSPNQTVNFQDKINLTPAERELGFLYPGTELKLFTLANTKIGINICYDSEFPLFAQQLAAAGAELILVPSCTDTLHGLTRVSISCRARAIENQCYVVHSALVGHAPWCPPIAENVGQAAIYTPVDEGFPPQGILLQGNMNVHALVATELNLANLALIRTHGQTTNFIDMQNHVKVETYPLLLV